uniref:Transcription factor che-1 n=1 Tax=Schistocephalus solidus TaxID=70667 RepID=A0A0X3PRQ9_SCHSO
MPSKDGGWRVTASSYPNVCSSSTETVVSNISISPAIKLSRTEVSETVSSPLHTVPVQLKSHVSLSSHLTRSASCHQTTGRFILPNKTTREVLDAPTNVNTTATAITPQVHLISLPPTSHGSSYIPTNTLKTAVPASTSLLCVNAQMLSSGGASFVLLPIAAASLMQSLSPSIPQAKAIENSAVLTGERQLNTAEPIDGRAQLLFLQTTGKEQARSCGNLDLQSIESPEVVVQQPCTSGGLSVTPPPDILGTNSADCPVSASFPNSASDPECLKTPLLPPLSSLSFSHTAATHENSAPHFEDRHQTVLPSAAHLLAPKSSSSSEVLVSLTTAKTTAVLKSEQSMSESGGGGRFTPRKRHQCPFCAKTCERKDNLQAHIRTHTGERPYPCRFCPKAFPQKDHLRAHIRTHTGEKPYHCVQCLKAFAQLGNLHRHVKTHRR